MALKGLDRFIEQLTNISSPYHGLYVKIVLGNVGQTWELLGCHASFITEEQSKSLVHKTYAYPEVPQQLRMDRIVLSVDDGLALLQGIFAGEANFNNVKFKTSQISQPDFLFLREEDQENLVSPDLIEMWHDRWPCLFLRSYGPSLESLGFDERGVNEFLRRSGSSDTEYLSDLATFLVGFQVGGNKTRSIEVSAPIMLKFSANLSPGDLRFRVVKHPGVKIGQTFVRWWNGIRRQGRSSVLWLRDFQLKNSMSIEGERLDILTKSVTVDRTTTDVLSILFLDGEEIVIRSNSVSSTVSTEHPHTVHKMKSLGFSGFRRLCNVELDMRPLLVMIGANGVGKTSVLDALSLLSASAAGILNRKLTEMGGVSDIVTRDKAADIVLRAEMEVPLHEPLKYELHLEPKGQTYAISYEVLSQSHLGFKGPFKHIESRYDDVRFIDVKATKRLIRPTWEHNYLETSLSQVPKMYIQPEELRRILSSVLQFHTLDVGARAPIKLPQQMRPAEQPGENGEDLVSFLYYLRESDTGRYETIEDTLRSAFPNFESLNFPPVAAGMLTMTWKERTFKKALYLHQLSEGILRFLWLVSLLQSPTLPTITLIDEPEVSLHPELLRLLAELMREAAKRTHLVVATHSDRFIRFLKPEEVLVMDINEDGCSTASWADTLDLDQWLADYSLDEVWRMGRMGGRS